ncbi:hypothetical protein [Diplocloster modestus]|uniref:Uncharacterized protein n=1 Tax=Diplocloster modestus TaxID=2850322 RepID=A0ABS6K5Q5_9FIRM|nr:hypothetical protein [Diplocloster modestus]MBU9725835.1 hypothetical protein [Diplocloster modestus]
MLNRAVQHPGKQAFFLIQAVIRGQAPFSTQLLFELAFLPKDASPLPNAVNDMTD